jgi:RNA-directed DNA polymerase
MEGTELAKTVEDTPESAPEDESEDKSQGTLQGGVISPLLANIYLNPLDWLMAGMGFEMVRYADDMVVLCHTEEEAREER